MAEAGPLLDSTQYTLQRKAQNLKGRNIWRMLPIYRYIEWTDDRRGRAAECVERDADNAKVGIVFVFLLLFFYYSFRLHTGAHK